MADVPSSGHVACSLRNLNSRQDRGLLVVYVVIPPARKQSQKIEARVRSEPPESPANP